MELRRDLLKHYRELFLQLLVYYPVNPKQTKHFNTGAMANIICSTIKKLMPIEVRDKFQVGYTFDGEMSQAFLTPTVEAANQRMIARMTQALWLRYDNESSFRL
jgi:hypothetical protein